jgi:hypothetical protein
MHVLCVGSPDEVTLAPVSVTSPAPQPPNGAYPAWVATRDQPTPWVSCPWALVVSNHRPPPCKGEANVLVRGLSRRNRVPLSAVESP